MLVRQRQPNNDLDFEGHLFIVTVDDRIFLSVDHVMMHDRPATASENVLFLHKPRDNKQDTDGSLLLDPLQGELLHAFRPLSLGQELVLNIT